MIPILKSELPTGDEWGYQLKWDGVRLIAQVDHGEVRLYSRNMLPKTGVYPELAESLSQLSARCVLDGEAVVMHPVKGRPDFPSILKRERSAAGGRRSRMPAANALYVVFDLLQADDRDLRKLPYAERHRLLRELLPQPVGRLLPAELASDGASLWSWVETHGWEGVVSKRLSSPYREGKAHRDWFKRKTAQIYEVDIVGLTIRQGRVASLVMSLDGAYFGRVSLGLDEALKRTLAEYADACGDGPAPWPTQPADLRGERIRWLGRPFPCAVTGLEITDAGVLRHPKLASAGSRHLAGGS